MKINAGRLGPAASRATGGIWGLPEQYQQNRSGVWNPPIVTGGVLFSDSTYYYRTFTANDTLTVSNGSLSADVLVVAGGGGGGAHVPSGGGGGGLIYRPQLSLNPGSYPITIGAGGAGSYNPGNYSGMPNASKGVNSTAFGLTALGGGFGLSWDNDTRNADGGSGGGRHGAHGSTGLGLQTSQSGDSGIYGFGNNGAAGNASFAQAPYPGSGGGGAGGVGQTAPALNTAGNGGAGKYVGDIFTISLGENGYFSGGGAGGAWGFTSGGLGTGGIGGGGDGDSPTDAASGTGNSVRLGSGEPTGESGQLNTGGGGGGAGRTGGQSSRGGNGGSGIVVVRYLKSAAQGPTTTWAAEPLAANLRLAMPLSSGLGFGDYSATIAGTGSNKQVTLVKSPTMSSSQSKFYGSSYDNGTETQDKYLSIPNSVDLALGTSDFCIEGWWYFTNTSTGYQSLAAHSGDSADQQNGWILITETNNTLYFYASDSGGWDVAMGGSFTPTVNTWHHIAVTRSGTTFRLFVNGTQVNTVTSSANITAPGSRELRLGSYRWIPGYPQSFNGFIQDFRMYIGASKYTANFTPPGAMHVGS